MEVRDFEGFIKETRRIFRECLINNNNPNLFIIQAYHECCSEFEETTLIENLKEEYGLYLKEEVV